jgi:hypothetical protein
LYTSTTKPVAVLSGAQKPAAKTNISFPKLWSIFAAVKEHFSDIVRAISKGDTSFAESFFRRPGGRRYLENISLILINTLAPHSGEKEEMYLGFVEVLDRMEQRIQRQKEGQEILDDISPDA